MSPHKGLAPTLKSPLRPIWSVTFDAGLVRRRPVTDGKTVVLAAHDHLIGVAADSGAVVWDQAQPYPITEIQACDRGLVIALGGEEDVPLIAYDWNGERSWRIQSGIGTGGDRLRGCGSKLVAIGVPTGKSTRQMCRVFDAKKGERLLEFPCSGNLPDIFHGCFVYSEQSADPGGGGLFLYEPRVKQARRLMDVGHSVRVVAEGLAIIDTVDDDNRLSRLIAIDLATGKVIWEESGGRNLSLAVSDHLLASGVAVDDNRLSMVLRHIKTGKRLWTASAIEADAITPLIVGGTVLGSIYAERIDVYDRSSGTLIQALDHETSLMLGGCVTEAGFVDVASQEAVCFAGAAA